MSSFHKSLTFSRPFLSLSLTFAVVTFGPSNLRSAALQSNLVEEKKALATDLTPSNGGSAELQGNARNGYGKLEMSFEANHGQTDATVDFLARGAGYTLFLTSAQAVFVMAYSTTGETPSILRMKLGGGSTQSVAEGLNRLPGIVNYFLGDDSEKWHANIPTFARVLYPGVYEGVDLVYYGNQSQLEYDFVVNPGTDYKKIELRFEGADKVEIDSGTGDLLLRLGENTLRQQKPIVYQEINGQRKQIESRYELKGAGGIGFAVSEYNSQLPLVIDPVLVYSTYLGGSGADAGNQIAVDAAGSAYITGETESANFPTVDPFQTIHAQKDAFVTKFNSTGSAVIYSTYLGGISSDEGHDIAVDSSGNAYVTGVTESINFPTVNEFQNDQPLMDGFVTKLNASGSALLYSTYLGGGDFDIINGLAVDVAGNAYVTGATGSINFPTVGAIQTDQPQHDAFVTKLNSAGSALVYSTYLGGSQPDSAQAIAVDSSSNAYVVGSTQSANFPTLHPIQTHKLENDAFVTKLNAAGSAFLYSTYLGGDRIEFANGIAVDTEGYAYVTGQTYSDDFPTVNAFDDVNPETDPTAFVAKINIVGTALIYSTYLGAGSFDTGFDIAVDSAGNAYVIGETTGSANFPIVNAVQPFFGGFSDAFVTKFNASGSALLYSTYLGGDLTDRGNGIAVDSAGNAHVTGLTESTNFPVTPNSFQPAADINDSVFITKIGSFSVTGRVIDLSGNPIAGVAVFLSGANSATTTTDASGNFAFFSTTSGGNFTVTPTGAGLIFSPPSITINNLNSNQELVFVANSGTGTPTPTPTPGTTSNFQFSAASFGVSEDVGHFQITVTRSGDTSGTATVDYATFDGTANDHGDYSTAIGRLRFGAGETARSFEVFITDDAYAEGNEALNITLSNPSAGSQIGGMMTTLLTIIDNDLVTALSNPIDSTAFFVRQHYVDFLNREPDAAGLAFWIANIESCGANSSCREGKRIDTSAAFFLSIEFQETGFLVERLYRAVFNRFPTYREFLRDTQELGRGVVVGQGVWEAQLAANRQQFILDFVMRSEFISIYSGFSNEQFVDALNANTVGSLSASERNTLLAGLNDATETRATVITKVAEDPDFVARERNPAFVLAEYFGYLRRNAQDAPDTDSTGFDFWLAKLNSFGGDFRRAEMVKAFISSAEYRSRFGHH